MARLKLCIETREMSMERAVQLPEDIKNMLESVKSKLQEFLEIEYIRTGRIRELEKLWLALEFPEYIRYKDTEWTSHSVELTRYEDELIRFMSTYLRGIIPDEAILKSDLGYIIKFSTTSMRVRDIIYEALVEILSSDERIKNVLKKDVEEKLHLLSRESKELAVVLYLDGDIVRDGKLILCNTYLETIFMPTVRIVFRRKDLSEEKLRDAVSELVKYGLLAHASWKFMNMLFNMYVVPPFLQDLWREIPLKLDVTIPKFRAIELEQRKHVHELINKAQQLIREAKLEEAIQALDEVKKLIDKILLT